MTEVLETKRLAMYGNVLFTAKEWPLKSISREIGRQFVQKKVIGKSPRLHFSKSTEKITISGVLYPGHRGEMNYPAKLREYARSGEPRMLQYTDEKRSQTHGRWVINRFTEKRTLLNSYGEPTKIEFTLELLYAGN